MPYTRLFTFDLGLTGLTTVGYYLGATPFSQTAVYERMADGSFRDVASAPGAIAGTGKYQAAIPVPTGTVNSLLWASDSTASALTGIDEINPGGSSEYLDASVASRGTSDYAGGDTVGTTTLLGLLTAARAAKLDNLDATVSGVSAKLDTLLTRIASTLTITAGKIDVNDRTGFALTSAERKAIAAATETALLDEGDGDAVLQAIVDKINATDANLSGLSLSAIAQAVWQYLTSGATLTGSMGQLVAANLDAKVSLRASQASVSAIPTNPALPGDVVAARDAVNAHTDAQAGVIAATVAGVKAKTDLLRFDGSGLVMSVAQNLPTDYQRRDVAITLPTVAPATWRVVLAAAQPEFAPAKPSDVSPTIAFSPTINPSLTGEQSATLLNLAAMMESSGVGGHERFKASALERSPSSAGGYTPDDRDRDAQTAAAVGALGGLPVSRVSPLGKGAAITVRKGLANTVARGDAIGPFLFAQDLTGAAMELHDALDGVIGSPVVTPPDAPGGRWSVSFETGKDAFAHRGRREYWVAARWAADGGEFDLHEKLSGTITVL